MNKSIPNQSADRRIKIMISYPPLPSEKGIPLLSQNRQFQWFNNPCYIYPMVPASTATLLKKNGFDVVWADGIASKQTPEEYMELIKNERPDVIMVESKTPVIKRHWAFIDEVKKEASRLALEKIGLRSKDNYSSTKRAERARGEVWNPIIVLVGDHVTALPEESMKNSEVDFVLIGGDYDFLMLNLCQTLETQNAKRKTQNNSAKFKNNKTLVTRYPLPVTILEPGIYYRDEKGKIQNTGKFQLNRNLNGLPHIDRDLTQWKLYAYDNGNYSRTPGSYIMAGRDCWWRRDGGCAFCAWTVLYPSFHQRSVKDVLDEVGELIENYGVKEIMDDSGTFPVGKWMEEFCEGMIKKGYNKKVIFDCNMRAHALTQKQYELMARAGFRFLLYGLESANEKTLEKINKGVPAGAIVKDCEMAKLANKKTGGNLQPHVTCMIGYPWETKEEAEKTIKLTRDLFDKGLIDTLQATIVIPYPGTALFKMCEENDWLKTRDWERYDMREPIMKTPMSDEEIHQLTQGLYKSFMTPRFILRKIASIRSWDDVRFFGRAGMAVLGHLKDFVRR